MAKDKKSTKGEYGASNIRVMEGIEHIRGFAEQ